MAEDIRWHQRLQSYQRALAILTSAVKLRETRALSELEQQGLIQAFGFTHELAWNVMQDYLQSLGQTMPIRLTPKDTIGGSFTRRQTLPVVAAPSFWALTG